MTRDVISKFLNISQLKESVLLKIEEDVTWVSENTCSYAAGKYNAFFGKSHTAESKNLISKSQIGNKKRLGKYHGEDTRKKISESNKNAEKVECIHCEKKMQRGVHNRWHGKNCKVINV